MNDVTNLVSTSVQTLPWLLTQPSVAIPVYQRDYRWSPDACEQLLEDIRRVADAPEGESHFIGSFLTVNDFDGTTLVDGQQRVTTLMLLLAAVGEEA